MIDNQLAVVIWFLIKWLVSINVGVSFMFLNGWIIWVKTKIKIPIKDKFFGMEESNQNIWFVR